MGIRIKQYQLKKSQLAWRVILPLTAIIWAASVPLSPVAADAQNLYFIDAHSQMAKGLDLEKIIPLMDQAGVRHTILSARNDRSPDDVASFASQHPQRITAAVRSKGNDFNNNTPGLKEMLDRQIADPVFKAMAEILLYHAKKGKKAPEITVDIESPQSRMYLDAAINKGWPFIAHYEFSAAGSRKASFMESLEKTMTAFPQLPFVLIHMGQLDAGEVRRLIEKHGNVYFMMSHSNPVTLAENSGQPWSNLFKNDKIAPDWSALMVKYPQRFVLAFDNVWPENWGSFYIRQAELWHQALGGLPPEVAHALAHGNAERLWKIAPQ